MIIDVTGTILTPSDYGKDCLGNGLCVDENGNEIECCCDECDYFVCCFGFFDVPEPHCSHCYDPDCPRSRENTCDPVF